MREALHVALSVDSLGPRLTGIGRYCLELQRGLSAMPGIDGPSLFRGDHWISDSRLLLNDQWRPRSRFRRRLDNRYWRYRTRNAVFHGPNYFLPPWVEGGIITIHDLSVLLYPETHPVERVQYFDRHLQDNLDRAAVVLCDCETVRGEVIAKLGCAPEKVFAIPLGVRALTATESAPLSPALGIQPNGYTLCVSTFEPRKRVSQLIEAYSLIEPALRTRVPLVLVGATGWLNDGLNEQIRLGEAAGWIKRLGFVPDPIRDQLCMHARLFVYPSMYEGFGLPPLEAMIHGVPTIVGNAPALVEITKGAAGIADVDDAKAFSAMIVNGLQNEAWRERAGPAGRVVALDYTWERCVNLTADIYRYVAA